MNEAPREQLLGFLISTATPEGCAAEVERYIRDGAGFRWLACLNPHSYAVALDRPEFARALHAADWLVADGVGVVLASRLLGGRIRERVTGWDVFDGLHRRLEATGGGRIFFLGSTPETLEAISRKMAAEHPGLQVVGTLSPPFRPEWSEAELDEMIATVNAARPDVLWVGLSAPKQEVWIERVRERLQVRFAGAIGAVFDFYVGNVKRSSPVFQRLGLEWLPRLLQEPRRLWRRTFVSAPVFVGHVLRARFLGGRPPPPGT